MPARRDFDPSEMVPILPDIFLIDVVEAPALFRVRLVGTGLVNWLGRDATGKMIDEGNYSKAAPGIQRIFNLVCERKAPIVKKGYTYYNPEKKWVSSEALLMPLSESDQDVNMILAAMVRSEIAPDQPIPPKTNEVWLEAVSDPESYLFLDPVIEGIPHSQRIAG